VDTADFDYALPADRIAQQPMSQRDAARLLVDEGPGRPPSDHRVRDLPDLLEPGDLVVVNRTRVLPARLRLRKSTGGTAEVLLLEARDGVTWEALVRPSRRLTPGTRLDSDSGALTVVVGADLGEGRRIVEVRPNGGDLDEALQLAGELPLPPYITDPLADPDRYQTVYAERAASAAAPTAGLHFTADLLARLAERGIERASIELVVGLGTFRPIVTDKVDDHVMHAECYRVEQRTWQRIVEAPRVVAVGTTTVRALETVALTGELEGRTELFIHRGFEFRVVDRLLTNFHQPRSSLLVMIDAFVGGGARWRSLYQHALDADYRFLSFGDAMLLSRGRARE
jgi:S-adenosylmethionine:tRNA ribosyltransferase-isomerase